MINMLLSKDERSIMWYRVFGKAESEPSPAALASSLHAAGMDVEPHFKGDDLGWTSGELRISQSGTPIYLERYLASEDDIRDDLNAYAAMLETCDYSTNHRLLMEHAIQTKQLIVIRSPLDATNEVMAERIVEHTCRLLAKLTEGVYQIDGRGWFSADGELLLQEY
jgi:hypothetical protein